jgi:multisubunit Na+/H+ antiporter MnhE subunit
VAELGVVIWVLIGWQFTLAEFVGGIVLIAIVSTAGTAIEAADRSGEGVTPGLGP